MVRIFEIKDKSGRNIYLSRERWSHINQEHPEVAPYLEEIKEMLQNPLKFVAFEYDDQIKYFYRYFKHKESPAKYLLVIVKYLNGEGYIITAYFTRHIK